MYGISTAMMGKHAICTSWHACHTSDLTHDQKHMYFKNSNSKSGRNLIQITQKCLRQSGEKSYKCLLSGSHDVQTLLWDVMHAFYAGSNAKYGRIRRERRLKSFGIWLAHVAFGGSRVSDLLLKLIYECVYRERERERDEYVISHRQQTQRMHSHKRNMERCIYVC